MPRVVFLNPPSNVPGKRKRMPGTDGNQKPEVKIMRTLSRVQTVQTMWERFELFNILDRVSYANHKCGSWCPIALQYPGNGNTINTRVGNQIFLKYLRLKGYISTYNNCAVPVHWRLRLCRCSDDSMNAEYGGNRYDTANHYLDNLYRNNMHFAVDDTAGNARDKACYNYYCGYKNMDTKDEIKVKTIASGVVNRNFAANKSSISLDGEGDADMQGVITQFPYSFSDFGGCTKFDVTVDLYDAVHFVQKMTNAGQVTEPDINYLLCLEVDIPFGVSVVQALPNYTQSNNFEYVNRLFDLKFNSILYFTDF